MMEDLGQKQTISNFPESKSFQEIRFIDKGDLNSGFEDGNAVVVNDVMYIIT